VTGLKRLNGAPLSPYLSDRGKGVNP
jgi:hypothetical protein